MLSHARNDETRSETVPSPASAVHGCAFTFTRLSARASASIFSSLGSLDPGADGAQGRSSSASLMDLQTASGSSELRMRERMSWASGLDFCRKRPKSSRSRSFSSWRVSHFRFRAEVRLTLASSTSYWQSAVFAIQRPHEGRSPSHCTKRLGSRRGPWGCSAEVPSPSSADTACKQPRQASSWAGACGWGPSPGTSLWATLPRPGAASDNASSSPGAAAGAAGSRPVLSVALDPYGAGAVRRLEAAFAHPGHRRCHRCPY